MSGTQYNIAIRYSYVCTYSTGLATILCIIKHTVYSYSQKQNLKHKSMTINFYDECIYTYVMQCINICTVYNYFIILIRDT